MDANEVECQAKLNCATEILNMNVLRYYEDDFVLRRPSEGNLQGKLMTPMENNEYRELVDPALSTDYFHDHKVC